MNWEPIVKSATITLENGSTYTVTELREGYDHQYKYYWIHGHSLDVIYCNNVGSSVGKGVRNNQDLINQLIKLFKLDGADPQKVVYLMPRRDPIYQPAVMYDSSDYQVIEIGELTKLEDKFNKSKYANKKFDVSRPIEEWIEIRKEDICIVQLPLDQKLIDYLWNWSSKALKEFLDSEFKKFMD